MATILLLSVIGIVLVLVELILPGGILGIIGALCLIGAVVATFVNYGAIAGVVAAVILTVFGFLTLGWWMKFFHRLPVTKNLMLDEQVGDDEALEEQQTLVGKKGQAVTDLHPSGKALIEGMRYDVMTEGPEIPRESPIEVTNVEGPSVFVRKIEG